MLDLISEFEGLPVPSKGFQFSAFQLKEYKNCRIAKDKDGLPSLLLDLTKEQTHLVINHQLRYISISKDIRCSISDRGKILSAHFTVISYIGHENYLTVHFLRVCGLLIQSLGVFPNDEKVVQALNELIELFKVAQNPPKKSLQGLWAELLLISQSGNVQRLLESWHNDPFHRFDFSLGDIKIEVKSSSTRRRLHHFSLEQLLPISGAEVFVCSVFAEEAAFGKSVHDLAFNIQTQIDDKHLINKLWTIIFRTLGDTVESANTVTFDDLLGLDSISYYRAESIPSVEGIPDEVSKVSFYSDLSGLPILDISF